MKQALALLFVSLFLSSQAEELPAKHKRQRMPPQWDTLFYKNELSLDGGLPLGFLLAAKTGEGSVALTYLRALTKSNFLRVGIRHYFMEEYYHSDNLWKALYTTTIPYLTITDKNYTMNAPDVRFGYEHRFGKRRIKCILGVDLTLGVEIENTSYFNQFYEPHQTVDSLGQTAYYFTEHNASFEERYPTSRQVNLKIGAAPFCGMFAHLSKRFSLRACVMYDLYWSHMLSFTSYNSTLLPGGDSFKINTWAIVGDVALTVHF
jgi:hypothetical protein